MLRIICAICCCAGVAGCIAGTVAIDQPIVHVPESRLPAYNKRMNGFDDMTTAIVGNAGSRGIPGTAWGAMPLTGNATFRGYGIVRIGDEAAPVATLAGYALVVVDFETEGIAGGLGDMVALSPSGAVGDVDGAISFSDGDIFLINPNDFLVRYDGTLSIFGQDYTLDGELDGLFRGTRLAAVHQSPIKAVSLQDMDGLALHDGVFYPLEMLIVADNLPASSGD